MAYAPSALVGNAGLPLDFLRRHAMARVRHEVQGEEPNGELGAGLMEDRPGARVNVVPALLARVGPPLVHRVELGPLVANGAMRFVAAMEDFHDLGEASIVDRNPS